MADPGAQFLSDEHRAAQARADLAEALAALQDRLTPAHLVSALGQSARRAAAPLLDPVIAQPRSSGGVIALSAAAAAVFYGLGHARAVKTAPAEPAAKTPDAPPLTKSPPQDGARQNGAPARRGNGLAKALILSVASLAAGAALGSGLPLSETEERFGRTEGRNIRRWAKNLAETHSGEIASGVANAFGIAGRVGSLLSVAALVAGQLTKKPDAGRPAP